jgi:uncharacterized protein (TIGR02391 family)
MFKEIFPPIETALDMEAEELAPFVLKHLKRVGKINRYNYTLRGHGELREYAGEHLEEFQKRLMEAFVWLEREMFVAPSPDEGGEWRFITRKGEKALQEEDFMTYVKDSLLPSKNLHPILARKVKPLFLRGDYDTAIFQAFKIIEVEVRKKGGYTNSDYGVDLMRKAFHPQTGSLTNTKSEQSEKQAMSDLFAGAIGLFKNPVSHRFIESVSPEDAADLIRFTNFLLTMLGS